MRLQPGLSFTEARRRLQGLDDQGLYWFEEPIPYHEFRNYNELRQHLSTPLILGENFHGIDHATLSLELNSNDAIMPDHDANWGSVWMLKQQRSQGPTESLYPPTSITKFLRI